MKHAGLDALDALEPLLADIRAFGALKEKSRGAFYRGSKATLHFHEDPEGLFADLRASPADTDFARYRVSTATERKAFLKAVKAALA